MLVLAMEFSKGAQRALRDAGHLQSDRWTGAERTGERPTMTSWSWRLRVGGWIHPGLPERHGPRVTPSKRNSDAHCHG